MRTIEHLLKMAARTRQAFERKYCLHPEAPTGCSPNIISAHSIQRALLKKFISLNGHVVQIRPSPQVEPIGMLMKPENVGLNNATTFSGFCGKHDTELFLPLENTEFAFTKQQIALLGYRAVCREFYSKDAEIAAGEAVWSYCSVNPDIKGFAQKNRLHQILQLARHNGRSNLLNAKNLYADMVSDQSNLRYYCIEFSEPPVYLTSVAFLPEWDFEGRQLQNLTSIAEYKPICFSAWATNDKAVAVFCWHDSANHICVPFIESLRASKAERLANSILSMAFEVSENVAFRRDWWEMLSETDRLRMISHSLSGVGTFERKSTCLKDDGANTINSTVDAEYVGY